MKTVAQLGFGSSRGKAELGSKTAKVGGGKTGAYFTAAARGVMNFSTRTTHVLFFFLWKRESSSHKFL